MKAIAACLFAGVLYSTLQLHVSPLEAATETVVYSFTGGADGAWPAAGMINVNGILYGVTLGDTTCGTVFSIDPKSGKETIVHSFAGGTDGCGRFGGLISVNSTLYGTTSSGGTGTCGLVSCGTVFAIDLTTGTETVLHSFTGGSDGQLPQAGLVDVNGTLYGPTSFGGAYGGGTVFSIDPATGAETVVYSFCESQCTSGFFPFGPLIDVKGTLYGTTTAGQGAALGTVFSLNPATGIETVVYSFCSKRHCADGKYPYSGLLKLNGNLYGTTLDGGSGCERKSGCGTVYSLNLATGAEAVQHAFAGRSDGKYPQAGLLSVDGTLYGTTPGGKLHHVGTVFSIDPTTGAETVLYIFQGVPDGAHPYAGLVNVNGTLYGTTIYGGTGTCKFTKQEVGCGTVFSITP